MTGTPPWLLPACAAALAAVVVGGSLVTAQRVEADLRARGCAALEDAGLADGTSVTWSGRDAVVGAPDDLGRLTGSVAVLAALRGTRRVTTDPAPAATPCAPATAASAAPVTAPGSDAPVQVVSVRFATNSADLDRAARAQLDALGGWLRDHPKARLRVRGHTDDTGFSTRNLPLSFDRAQAVADYLESHGDGVAVDEVRGLSSLEPLVPNVSPENRALNRRADVVVEGSG